MGVQLRNIVPTEIIELRNLKGKVLAIDAMNALYQFLSTIRQRDGTPLMDSRGRITSHLSGLFYRNINLLSQGIRLVYVFDGRPPNFKKVIVEKRKSIRDAAEIKWSEAIISGNKENAKKFAQQSAKVTPTIISEANTLLKHMGIPTVQAPSEGEAQAAFMAAKNQVFGAVSQDYDSLLFGSPILLRNITISAKKKLPNKNIYIDVPPEEIWLKKLLKELGITRNQLILIGILTGTDFNPGGVKGLGSKKGLKLVKKYPSVKELSEHIKWDFDVSLDEIFDFFISPPVTENFTLKFDDINEDKLIAFLCDDHEFSEERVIKSLKKLKKSREIKPKQVSLNMWVR